MEAKQTLGIYGGTFSPPHLGHVNAGLAFLRQLNLDRLLIMPARIPPHKPDAGIDPIHRLKMTELAFGNAPEYGKQLSVSDYEITLQAVSYTVNTLRHYHAQGYKLYFLCGTDMFLSLDRWREPESIFALCTIAYIRREDESPEISRQIEEAKVRYREKFNAECVEIVSQPIEVSSSEIRAMLEAGKDASHLISTSVNDYIRANGLYMPAIEGGAHRV